MFQKIIKIIEFFYSPQELKVMKIIDLIDGNHINDVIRTDLEVFGIMSVDYDKIKGEDVPIKATKNSMKNEAET